MAAPEEKAIVRFFCRHLVGLFIAYRDTGQGADSKTRFSPCSGTIAIFNKQHYFLTAGHVLREIDNLRNHKNIKIESSALGDVFADTSVCNKPIPFDLKAAKFEYVDDDALGLDFGLIPLSPHYVRLLSKNGIRPITAENWERQHNVRFDGYVMLGFPTELASEFVSKDGDVDVVPVLFPVKKLRPDANAQDTNTAFERFVGTISQNLPLKSIKGMSGGLIIGLRQTHESRYWIVAIQSAWNLGTRTIYACPMPTIGRIVESKAA